MRPQFQQGMSWGDYFVFSVLLENPQYWEYIQCRTLFQCLTEQPRVVVCLKCCCSIAPWHCGDMEDALRVFNQDAHWTSQDIFCLATNSLKKKNVMKPPDLHFTLGPIVSSWRCGFMSFNLKDYCVAFKCGEFLQGILNAHVWFSPLKELT
jgi:hypothetical protein